MLVIYRDTNTHTHVPSFPDARSFLVPSFVKQVVSHIDQQMPRTNYKPEDRSNVDCMTVIGRLVETLAEPQLGVTDDDIEFLSPLIHPLMRLHKVLTPNNTLVVRTR